jgi:uncharacterized protein (DUF2062 family)
MWSVEQLKARLKEMLSARSSPHEIALGFTIGTFISILPTPGFNLLLGALVIAIYPHVNKLAVFGAMAVYNPIIMIPFYWASYQLGALLFGDDSVVHYDVVVLDQAFDFTRRYLIGNVIVACVTSGVTYPLVRRIVQLRRSRAAAPSEARS